MRVAGRFLSPLRTLLTVLNPTLYIPCSWSMFFLSLPICELAQIQSIFYGYKIIAVHSTSPYTENNKRARWSFTLPLRTRTVVSNPTCIFIFLWFLPTRKLLKIKVVFYDFGIITVTPRKKFFCAQFFFSLRGGYRRCFVCTLYHTV